MTLSDLAAMIDHTLLKAEASTHQVRKLCEEARQYGFWAVCVSPARVSLAAKELQGTGTNVAAVVGFPHGNTLSEVKGYEAQRAIDAGATELDMVIHVGALKERALDVVERDIRAVVEAARRQPETIVKVILETALLTDDEKVLGCQIAEQAGAHFVKTSTGFATKGATAEDVTLMRRTVGQRLGVKAAGGIRDLATARIMVEAGATRLGCSASVAIVEELASTRARP